MSLAGPSREIIVEPATIPASAPKPQPAPQPATAASQFSPALAAP